MNIKILSLAITLVTGLGFCAQDAFAQESRGQRFSFAPNVWKVEQPRIPGGGNNGPAHAVRNGAVPSSNFLLGGDPNTLPPAPPPTPAPIVRPSVQAVPSNNRVAGNVNPKPSFNPLFGTPGSPLPQQPAPPQVAQTPITPPAQPMPPMMRAPQQPAHSPVVARSHGGHHRRATSAVTGRLTARKPTGDTAAPQALSYDRGYVPGGTIAAGATSGGGGSTTAVSGRVMNHRRKH